MSINALRTASGLGSRFGAALPWKKFGIGVAIGFTLKGLVTTALMLMVMYEFLYN